MTKEQAEVKEFMQTFGQECPEKPTVPSLEIRKLRAKLMLEELFEIIEKGLGLNITFQSGWAHCQGADEPTFMSLTSLDLSKTIIESNFNVDLVELADGLADLHYVAYCGTAIACGLDVEPIFQEVHRSNMTKLWTLTEWDSITYRFRLDHTISMVKDTPNGNGTDRAFLIKNKDGKVIKSPSYSPANIQPIIDAQSK